MQIAKWYVCDINTENFSITDQTIKKTRKLFLDLDMICMYTFPEPRGQTHSIFQSLKEHKTQIALLAQAAHSHSLVNAFA